MGLDGLTPVADGRRQTSVVVCCCCTPSLSSSAAWPKHFLSFCFVYDITIMAGLVLVPKVRSHRPIDCKLSPLFTVQGAIEPPKNLCLKPPVKDGTDPHRAVTCPNWIMQLKFGSQPFFERCTNLNHLGRYFPYNNRLPLHTRLM